MFYVTKTFRVPVGHRLSKHKGLCKNIHGHNLKIEVTLGSEKLDENGMVLDFYILKNLMDKILPNLDHAVLLNSDDKETGKIMEEGGFKHYYPVGNNDPTAEMLCLSLYAELATMLFRNKKIRNEIKVKRIKIWENDDAFAEYTEE
jgi:6-pyruvoyltetrahydropterin/6-carboxytetrahydropterin synthase